MTLLPGKAKPGRTLSFVPDWREGRAWTRSALTVRSVQVLAGVAVFLLPQHHHTISDALLVLGLIVAVVSPARNGQGLVLIGAMTSWLFSDGADTMPPVDRVLAFAFAVYVLSSATTLASTAPMGCVIRPELVRHWLIRSGLALLASSGLIALVYLIDAITSGTTTALLQLAGVVGVLIVVATGAVLFTRLLKTEPDR